MTTQIVKPTTISFLQLLVVTVGVFVTIIVYFHRRYTLRKNLAFALSKEIQDHRKDLKNIQPHIDEKRFKESKEVTGSNGDQWNFHRYEPEYVPSPSRLSTDSYDRNTETVAAFKQDTFEGLNQYYSDIRFVRQLLKDINKGNWMPQAAFVILETKMDELKNSEEIEKQLKTEKEFRTKETLKGYINTLSSYLYRLKHYMTLYPAY